MKKIIGLIICLALFGCGINNSVRPVKMEINYPSVDIVADEISIRYSSILDEWVINVAISTECGFIELTSVGNDFQTAVININEKIKCIREKCNEN